MCINKHNCLVVWNISCFLFHKIKACHPFHWRTHIFKDGVKTTNQIIKKRCLWICWNISAVLSIMLTVPMIHHMFDTHRTINCSLSTITGWWFGTVFIFPYFGSNNPNWLIFFRGVETTNQISYSWPWLHDIITIGPSSKRTVWWLRSSEARWGGATRVAMWLRIESIWIYYSNISAKPKRGLDPRGLLMIDLHVWIFFW